MWVRAASAGEFPDSLTWDDDAKGRAYSQRSGDCRYDGQPAERIPVIDIDPAEHACEGNSHIERGAVDRESEIRRDVTGGLRDPGVERGEGAKAIDMVGSPPRSRVRYAASYWLWQP